MDEGLKTFAMPGPFVLVGRGGFVCRSGIVPRNQVFLNELVDHEVAEEKIPRGEEPDRLSFCPNPNDAIESDQAGFILFFETF
jgi:hypothetical protein